MTTSPAPEPGPTTATTDARVTVEAFLDALCRLDVEAATALLDEHVVYQNVPTPPVRGREAAVRVLRGFLVPFRGFEVEMLSIAGEGGTVLTERVDTFTNGPLRIGFWVCGTFEVQDGRITVWRDRFDVADLVVAIVRGVALAPWRAVTGR